MYWYWYTEYRVHISKAFVCLITRLRPWDGRLHYEAAPPVEATESYLLLAWSVPGSWWSFRYRCDRIIKEKAVHTGWKALSESQTNTNGPTPHLTSKEGRRPSLRGFWNCIARYALGTRLKELRCLSHSLQATAWFPTTKINLNLVTYGSQSL